MPFSPEPIDLFIGHKIRHFRTKKAWPLKVLADRLDISLQQVQKYELGQSRISAGLLYKLGIIFDVSPGLFFDGFILDESHHSSNQADHHLNILVIDDNPEDDFILRKALEDTPQPLNVYTIHSGDDALTFFRALEGQGVTELPKPHIIFLDLHMPHMNGLDLLKSLKTKPICQNIPIVILTNSSNAKDMTEAYKHHASGFVRKSFSFDEFKAHIQQVVTYWTKAVVLPELAA
ncbi:MAG TPA: response regulator [Alphaproteobacteria bacterium]|nr:response regulator [Alphaproteobacteria bacterium]